MALGEMRPLIVSVARLDVAFGYDVMHGKIERLRVDRRYRGLLIADTNGGGEAR